MHGQKQGNSLKQRVIRVTNCVFTALALVICARQFTQGSPPKRPSPTYKSVVADTFVLRRPGTEFPSMLRRNPAGHVVLTLPGTGGQSNFSLGVYGNGVPAVLAVKKAGMTGCMFQLDEAGRPGLSLSGGEPDGKLWLFFPEGGGPVLSIDGGREPGSTCLTAAPDGSALLWLAANGKVRVLRFRQVRVKPMWFCSAQAKYSGHCLF